MFRLYMVKNGNHFDSFVNNPKLDPKHMLQPLLPYVHQSFDALVEWVEAGKPAPKSQTIGLPYIEGKAVSIINGRDIEKY